MKLSQLWYNNESSTTLGPVPCANSWSQMLLRHARKHPKDPVCLKVHPSPVSYRVCTSSALKTFQRAVWSLQSTYNLGIAGGSRPGEHLLCLRAFVFGYAGARDPEVTLKIV